MKLLAVDGNSIINRAFYGIKLLTTKDGHYTNAVYGFINILLKLIDEQQPDGVAVAWDLKKPTFRHNLYKEYKAGRHAMPAELAEQFEPMKRWLTLMGFRCIECEGYEADDILGTLAAAADRDGSQCIIATGDRDSLQLISENTHVVLSVTKMGRPENTEYDEAALFAKYGMKPYQMIELKSLMGDSSDNIPGVAGIGEKTATMLVSQYDNIDYIYENLDSIDIKDSVKTKLSAGRDSAYMSKTLGTICREAPIDTKLEDYKIGERQDGELSALMTSLELYKLMGRLNVKAGKPVAHTDAVRGNVKAVTATDLLKCGRADIVFDGDTIAVCDGKIAAKGNIDDFKVLLSDNTIEKRVYDSKSFYKLCRKHGIEANGVVFDSMLAGYLSSPSASSYEIKRLADEYGAVQPETDSDDELVNLAALHSFACDALIKELEKNGQLSLLGDIELPLARVLGNMETEGFLVDTDGIREYGLSLEKRISDIQSRIFELVGYEFNLNSPKQLGEALFERLGLPAKKKTKSGYSTNADVLESLRYAHPSVALLLEYRQLAKLKSTYCDGLLKQVGDDGRIHSTFNQTETRTGRISSTEPNLQNIPVRSEEGKQLRKFFKAKDGYVLCDADYSQIELRVLAHIANDKNMLNAFNNGIDIHTLTASEVFSVPVEMVTPVMRSNAKAVNFGIVYGIGAFSLSKDIGVTRAEADSYIKGYLATYPQIDAYMKSVIEQAKRDGFVTTVFGRRRYLPELASSNAILRSFGERVARNMPIQGAAADIIKIAMIKVSNRLAEEKLDAQLILQVHDELIIEARDDCAQTVCNIVREEMEGAASLSVKLSVDAGYGKTWYDAKK